MPSNCFLFLTVMFSACTVFAVTPGAVFERHRDGILSGEVAKAEGVYFAVGMARAVTDSVAARQTAQRKATLSATASLAQRATTERVVWPKTLDVGVQQELTSLLVRIVSVNVTLSGCVSVYSEEVDKGTWRVVVAVSEEELAKVPRLTFEEARERLLREDVLLAKGAPLDALIALRRTMGNMPESVDWKPWEALLLEADFGTPRLRALPRLAGRYPLGSTEVPTDEEFAKGNEAYGKGDLATAYAAFVASAERAWTFDALNMAGNVARRLPGHSAEASALLLHAAYLKPSSPHPWVHLAFVAKAIGNKALCEQCCREAEARSPDAWTREQLAILRAKRSKPSVESDAKATQEFQDNRKERSVP